MRSKTENMRKCAIKRSAVFVLARKSFGCHSRGHVTSHECLALTPSPFSSLFWSPRPPLWGHNHHGWNTHVTNPRKYNYNSVTVDNPTPKSSLPPTLPHIPNPCESQELGRSARDSYPVLLDVHFTSGIDWCGMPGCNAPTIVDTKRYMLPLVNDTCQFNTHVIYT